MDSGYGGLLSFMKFQAEQGVMESMIETVQQPMREKARKERASTVIDIIAKLRREDKDLTYAEARHEALATLKEIDDEMATSNK